MVLDKNERGDEHQDVYDTVAKLVRDFGSVAMMSEGSLHRLSSAAFGAFAAQPESVEMLPVVGRMEFPEMHDELSDNAALQPASLYLAEHADCGRCKAG